MAIRRIFFSSSDEDVPINLTPLIDVVFVILFAFIIIAPLLNIDQVELATSQNSQNQKQGAVDGKLTIRVNRDNTIVINEAKVDMVQLEKYLRQYKQAHPEVIPLLLHDRTAHFGTYQTIKDLVGRCGFQQLDVALK